MLREAARILQLVIELAVGVVLHDKIVVAALLQDLEQVRMVHMLHDEDLRLQSLVVHLIYRLLGIVKNRV